MLELTTASERNYQSVKNWVEGNKPLVRSESSLFLQPVNDTDIVALRKAPQGIGVEKMVKLATLIHPGLSSKVSLSL